MTIEEIFEGGSWVGEEEYVIRCPFCGDSPSHNHFFINIKKRLFNCYFCGETGHLSFLLKKFGEGLVCDLDEGRQAKVREVADIKPTDFFKDFQPIIGGLSQSSCQAFRYLTERGINELEIQLYQIYYASAGRYKDRVIIPIIENEKVVCFSARTFLGAEPKYLFPHKDETIITTAEAIYGIHWAHEYQNVVLVEGAFDAMGINRKLGWEFCGLSLLSKHMSQGQFMKLLKLPLSTSFYVMLDADAYSDGVRMVKKLHQYGREVKMCFLPQGDPASESSETLQLAIASAEEYYAGLELRDIK